MTPILLLGAGRMGGALIAGWAKAGEVTDAAVLPAASPSGERPISWGVREKIFAARIHTVSTMVRPIAAAASGKPAIPIAATQRGEKTTPPMLAPL